MAETIRDVVVKIRLQQENNKLKAPDMSEANAALDAYRKKVEDIYNISRKPPPQALPAPPRVDPDSIPSWMPGGGTGGRGSGGPGGRGWQPISNSAVENATKYGPALREAAEGSMQLARGLVLVSSASEDNLRKMIKQVAFIQGAADIFRGTTQVAGQFEKVLMGIGVNAKGLGAVGIAIGAVGAAVALGAKAFDESGRYAEEYREKLARLKSETQDFIETQERLTNRALEVNQAWINMDSATAQTRSPDERLAELLGQRGRGPSYELRSAEKTLREAQAERGRLRQEQLKAIEAANRTDYLVDPDAARTAYRRVSEISDQLRLATEKQDNSELNLARLKAQELAKQQKDELEIFNIGQNRIKGRQQEIEQLRQSVVEIDKAKKLEEDRIRAVDASLGRLSPADRRRIEQIASRAEQGGDLNRRDLQFLDKFQQFRGFTDEQFARQSRERGDAERFQVLLGGPLRGAGSPLAALDQQRAEDIRKIEEIARQIKQDGGIVAAAKGLVEAVSEKLAQTESIIALLTTEFQKKNNDR